MMQEWGACPTAPAAFCPGGGLAGWRQAPAVCEPRAHNGALLVRGASPPGSPGPRQQLRRFARLGSEGFGSRPPEHRAGRGRIELFDITAHRHVDDVAAVADRDRRELPRQLEVIVAFL